MVYFSDIFNIDESILEEYGAMNISLLMIYLFLLIHFFYMLVKKLNIINYMKA